MPDGTTSSAGDSAPEHSPVQVNGINLSADFLTFKATGGVFNNPFCQACSLPDGDTLTTPNLFPYTNHRPGAINGISDIRAPINSLLAIFLDDNQPDGSLAPMTLDFELTGLEFLTLTPVLKQVFFVGDGSTTTGEIQQFAIPDGATRLYLGTMDGFGWHNNNGAYDVEVSSIPIPATANLFVSGLISLFGMRKVKRLQSR
jgi:hypothetical protein